MNAEPQDTAPNMVTTSPPNTREGMVVVDERNTNHRNVIDHNAVGPLKGSQLPEEDGVSFAAMQEAATIVMTVSQHEAQQQPDNGNVTMGVGGDPTPAASDLDTTSFVHHFDYPPSPNHHYPHAVVQHHTLPQQQQQPQQYYTYPFRTSPTSQSTTTTPQQYIADQDLALPTTYTPIPTKKSLQTTNVGISPPQTSKRIIAPVDVDAKPNNAAKSQRSAGGRRMHSTTRLSWEERLAQLEEYKAIHGNLLIPIRYKVNPSLGKFVHNTREQYKLYQFNLQQAARREEKQHHTPQTKKKSCTLTTERLEQLQALGFVWTTQRSRKQADDWQQRMAQLATFQSEHDGSCMVPYGYAPDPSLAEWVHRQRVTFASLFKKYQEQQEQEEQQKEVNQNNPSESPHKPSSSNVAPTAVSTAKKENPMLQQRLEQLIKIGFNFAVHSDRWLGHWNDLQAYHKEHGNCQVPTHFSENPKLGRWVHTQRHQQRLMAQGKKSCMTQERKQKLDDLGFNWEVRPVLKNPRTAWNNRLDELTEFFKAHGHFRIPSSQWPLLLQWCQEQKAKLRKDYEIEQDDIRMNCLPTRSESGRRMQPERVKALKDLGFTKDSELGDPQPMSAPVQKRKHDEMIP